MVEAKPSVPIAALKSLRAYQWSKNVLVFLPILGAQAFGDTAALLAGTYAFFAFSFVASAFYLVNDAFDAEADRKHPIKRNRPIASGALPMRAVPLLVLGLLGSAAALATQLPLLFAGVLLLYACLTTAYTLRIKRMVLADVFVLAALYCTRILAGAAATGIVASVWLLGFSLFFFLSLALVKRYAELHAQPEEEREAESEEGVAGRLRGRGYQQRDLPVLIAFGVGTGCMAVLILSLYIISNEFRAHYTHAWLLWQLSPLTMYWLARAWIVVARDEMEHDPVLWAFRDPLSRIVAVLALAILIFAR